MNDAFDGTPSNQTATQVWIEHALSSAGQTWQLGIPHV